MSNFLQQSGGYALIDGGLATELERHGADLNDPLWSAKYTSITLKQVRILFSRHLIRLLFRGLNLKACQKKIVKHCCREVLKLHVRPRDTYYERCASICPMEQKMERFSSTGLFWLQPL
ncbi:hypothetical protein IFM89_035617 [Coptis chinensis]|uniref:Uncharacterized protein n=1 Tax=Coptis chinensis TaxID=261450 RepID=A0A835HSD0_9MAGN|nr:hypothetical protein IFM89_035617 [Coptis chinensis]